MGGSRRRGVVSLSKIQGPGCIRLSLAHDQPSRVILVLAVILICSSDSSLYKQTGKDT